MKENEIAISVKNLSKSFRLPHEKQGSIKNVFIGLFKGKTKYEKQKVLKNISFDIKKGEFFGIVGRNGSGKSTLLKLLAGVYSPNEGRININGKLTPFIELGVGFNMELTGRENVFLNGALLGFDRSEINAMYDEIVEFAELGNFMDQKLKNYSSGMQVRLAFAIAIQAKTDILLLDEVLAVGDYDFQQKCFEYFRYLKKIKKTVVLVSHDMNNIQQFCTSGAHIKEGLIVEAGDIVKVVDSYRRENVERAEKSLSMPSKREVVVTGNGDATIEEIYTCDSKGKIKKTFKPYDEINICFLIKANKDLENSVVGMVFADTSGKMAFATNSLDKNQHIPTIKKGNSVIVKYSVPNLYHDSVYVVSGAIANNNRTEVFARIESAYEFKTVGWSNTAQAPFYPEHEIIIETMLRG